MSWILDVLIIVIFFGTVIGYTRRGFVKSILGFGRTLISAILSWFFGPDLASWISEKIIGDKITQNVYDIMVSGFGGDSDKFNFARLFEQAPEGFVRFVERLGGNLEDLKAKYGSITEASPQELTELSQSIAAPINTVISYLFGYLIVFLAAYLGFVLLAGILTKVFELPLLRQLNSFLGFILGLAFGVLNTAIFCFFGSYLIPFLAAITAAFVAEDLIAGSVLFEFLLQFKLF